MEDERLIGINPETAQEYDFENCPTRQNRYSPFHKPDVVAAIYAAEGVFAHMSMLLGRRRESIRYYVYSHPDVLNIWKELRESALDYIEHSVIKQALNGDPQQQRFVLQTLGKDRGYSNRTEATGANGGPIDVNSARVDPAKLDNETKLKLLEAMKTDDDSYVA